MQYFKNYMIIFSILLLLFVGVLIDSQIRGKVGMQRLRAQLEDIVPLMMSADTAMNNSARFIRHRALSYPGDAFSDFAGQQDYFPAAMAWPPPDFPGVQTRLRVIQKPSQAK